MTQTAIDLAPYIQQVGKSTLLPWTGEIVELVGMLVASRGPAVAVGDFCEVLASSGRRVRTQVIGFRDGHVLSMPLEEIDGIQLHDRIIARQDEAQVAVGPDLIGRVLDGFGRPIDRRPPIRPAAHVPPVPSRPAARSTASTSPADRHRHSRHRHHDALRQGAAHGDFRRQRRRQEHAARRHGAAQFRRRHGDRAGRRAQPRSARLPGTRTGSGRQPALRGGLLDLRPAGARCASAPASSPWRSPSISATRAPTFCSLWIR